VRPALPIALLLGLHAGGAAQTTRAERTAYRETSSHADVLGFSRLAPAARLVASSAGATFPILRSRSPVRAAAHALP
jgi:hypothetical protein